MGSGAESSNLLITVGSSGNQPPSWRGSSGWLIRVYANKSHLISINSGKIEDQALLSPHHSGNSKDFRSSVPELEMKTKYVFVNMSQYHRSQSWSSYLLCCYCLPMKGRLTSWQRDAHPLISQTRGWTLSSWANRTSSAGFWKAADVTLCPSSSFDSSYVGWVFSSR